MLLIDPFLGISDTLYRMRIGTVSLRHSWPRDMFTLSGSWQDQDPVSYSSLAVQEAPRSGIYATFSWGHEINPRTSTIATVNTGHHLQHADLADQTTIPSPGRWCTG